MVPFQNPAPQPAPQTSSRVVIDVDRDGWTKGLQLNIVQLDENGSGWGYRLHGPKYNGSSENLLRCELDEQDAAEIREALAAAFPTPAGTTATPQPAELIIYRASHDSIVMGLYRTAAEARKHCEAEERRAWLTGTDLAFGWVEDEEDGVAELVTVDEDGETETITGYVVTALEVASKYDEEADE